MEDIELVIKIPEEIYKLCQEKELLSTHPYKVTIWNAVANGTSLPKGHGRLIDADELKKEYPHDTDWDYPVNSNSYVAESIDNLPTIIDAESEEKE